MEKEKTVWLHRCHFAPLFINTNYKTSENPALLNYKQLEELGNTDSGYIFNLPEGFLVDDEITKEYEEYLEILNTLGISNEECIEKIKSNYLQQAKKFFENGLYTIYTSLDRTATQYSDEEINKKTQLHNFGFNDFRGNINAAFILEIPPKCFEFMGQQQLYENSDKSVKVLTQYHGFQETSKVVPSQYIKKVIVHYGESSFTFDNPNFDLEYIPKNNGIGMELYDRAAFTNLKYFIDNPANEEKIISYVLEIKEKATEQEYKSFLIKLLQLCESREDLQSQASFIDEELDKLRTPYEKSYEVLKRCNPENISLDELENIVLDFLQKSNINFQNTLRVDDLYKKGNALIQKLCPYLSTSSKFNVITGEIGKRDNIIKISEYIFRYVEIICMYEECGKDSLALYGVCEEQIPQIRQQYQAMNESLKKIATSSDQNNEVNRFWNMYANGVISLSDNFSENSEQPLQNGENIGINTFSSEDIGEASYDAELTLCKQAANIIDGIQRSYKKNGHRE